MGPSLLSLIRILALLTEFAPEPVSLLAVQLTAVLPLRGRLRLEQRNSFPWQQFAADDLQPLAVLIPANRTKAQHGAAITEPPGA